jgi:hypothetical protein
MLRHLLSTFITRQAILISLVFITACQEKSQLNAKADVHSITIPLLDSLGAITIERPILCDTLLVWIRRNDCGKTCEEGKYRFQPKNLPIFKESGFYWTGQAVDSVNQLTITHLRPSRFRLNSDSFAIWHYSRIKEDLEADPETRNLLSDTVQKIGDRYFCIFRVADIDKNNGVSKRRLIAITSVS